MVLAAVAAAYVNNWYFFFLFWNFYKIFGEGGVKRTAEEFGKEFLGEIPINPEVGKCGDEGKPIVEAKPDHEISKIYFLNSWSIFVLLIKVWSG